jgi:hypothetical protein
MNGAGREILTVLAVGLLAVNSVLEFAERRCSRGCARGITGFGIGVGVILLPPLLCEERAGALPTN